METIDTAEPDEFARLLAQLNGDPVQPDGPVKTDEPVKPVAPAPPVSLQPSPPEESPAPPASSLFAPAFGMAAPAPPVAPPAPPAIVFPSAVPPAPIVPAAAASPAPAAEPPAALAPELMGADELAAAPSVPGARTTAAAFSDDDGTSPSLIVSPSALAAALASSPPPSVSPVAAPAPLAASAASPPPAPSAAPTGPRAPFDFAGLFAAPVGADGTPGSAPAALALGGGPEGSGEDGPDLARATLSERIGLILAILLAPIGLILGIVSAIGSSRRRGWVIGMVRATLVIGAVLTVVLAIGGYFAYTQYQQQQRHDQTAAESAAFCATLKADPTMYQAPTFGWPSVASSIPDTLTAMQAFEDRWTKLAKVSPAGIRADAVKEAASAKQIIDSVTVSRTVDDAANIAVMTSVASGSGIPAWRAEYCK